MTYEDDNAQVIDGDTVIVSGQTIRIVGIDAPDKGNSLNYELAAGYLYELSKRDEGLECSPLYFNRELVREPVCSSPAQSYGRINSSCKLRLSGGSVAATLVAHGYAVDYRRYSGGAFAELMNIAARESRGLWGLDYEFMRRLAYERGNADANCDE